MIISCNFASNISIMNHNKFLDNLRKFDPENFEYKVDKDFEAETGIRGKRLQSIIKSGGTVASVQEANSLLEYYSHKQGRKLEFYELFGKTDNVEKTVTATQEEDTEKSNDIYDAF